MRLDTGPLPSVSGAKLCRNLSAVPGHTIATTVHFLKQCECSFKCKTLSCISITYESVPVHVRTVDFGMEVDLHLCFKSYEAEWCFITQ